MPTRRLLPCFVALTTLALASNGQARGGAPFYNGDLPAAAYLDLPEAKLRSLLNQELKSARITQIKRLTGEVVAVDKLTHPEAVAVLMTLGSQAGAENDLLVTIDNKITPITVFWEEKTISFEVGSPMDSVYKTGATKESIQKKYKIGPMLDSGKNWDAITLSAVDQALAYLTPEELKLIEGMPFHRRPKEAKPIPGVRGSVLAIYLADEAGKRIELYDMALTADKLKFSGSVKNPVPQSVAMLVHEVGHALAKYSAGLAQQAAIDAQEDMKEQFAKIRETFTKKKAEFDVAQKKLKADIAEHNAQKKNDPNFGKDVKRRNNELKAMSKELSKLNGEVSKINRKNQQLSADAQRRVNRAATGMSPAEAAFNRVVRQSSSPTLYGRTLPGENYAESYRMFKVDKPALQRAAPKAVQWFTSPAYWKAIMKVPE